MYKIILFAVILILCLGSMFCSDNPTSFVQGDNVTLYYGQTVTFGPDKIKIRFDSLLSESRCPDDALIRCFWQGMAAIQLSLITEDNDSATVVASIEGLTKHPEHDSYTAVDTLGLSIELIGLTPYPKMDRQPSHSEYRARLRVKTSTAGNEIDGQVLIIHADPNDLLQDDYSIDSSEIDDDILTLSVAYSGGCKTHYFFAFVDGEIMESNPPQANLYLHHFGNDDLCEAYLHQELRFDLKPLAEYFQSMYPDDRDLIIRINESSDGSIKFKEQVIYNIK